MMKLCIFQGGELNVGIVTKDVNVFLPFTDKSIENIKKSQEDPNAPIIVAGWGSTSHYDFQGESIDPAGIDDSYFRENGWIDYEHDRDRVIGIPTERTFTDPNKGLFVEAELFRDSKEVHELLKLNDNLASIGSGRKLGFSIEGQISARDEDSPNVIRSVLITGVAITKNPANSEATWDLVQKSFLPEGATKVEKSDEPMTAGTGTSPETQVNGGALRPESIAGHITNVAYAMAHCNPDELQTLGKSVATILDKKNSSNDLTKTIFLQVFKGMSRDSANELLKSVEESEEHTSE